MSSLPKSFMNMFMNQVAKQLAGQTAKAIGKVFSEKVLRQEPAGNRRRQRQSKFDEATPPQLDKS